MVKGSAKQSTNYGNNSYPASNAWSNGPKFTHTNAGVGQWWEVGFDNEYYIGKVRILNRRDCCGGRLAGTKVMVGNQLCGTVQGGTKNGQWYDVTCSRPMKGRAVRLVTTQRTYLSISGFEAYTGMGVTTRTMRSTSTSRTRSMPPTMKMGGFKGGWGMSSMVRRAVPFKMSFSMGSDKVTLNQGSA